ncbi:hypothetical protein [Vogesella indigofera]|uniref:hypothetical protein n=1 Tax=Vogesella indigofera TaxID=45465 RepID=UPI00234F65CD|nr:hypothetical protein [Vogesella indigofera]MDC7700285.1 hypothetical protein [Vogesella indigofera]
MSVPFHPVRYAASRPWAKRVAHLFEHGGKTAVADCDALLRRTLQAAPGGVGMGATRQEAEGLLAQAYGHFVRHGRQLLLCDAALGAALAATHPPKALPATPTLPLAACFIALPDNCGAYVHSDEEGAWQVLMLAAGFAQGNSGWWQQNAEVLALTLRGGDSLQLPDIPAVQPWRAALLSLFNHLALLAQPRCLLTAASSPAEQAEALRRGKLPVRRLSWEGDLVQSEAFDKEGYWRRQTTGAAERLVWVPPR